MISNIENAIGNDVSGFKNLNRKRNNRTLHTYSDF